MASPFRFLLAGVLLLGCGQQSGSKIAGSTGDGAAPGDEAGPPGSRGGGGGAFGGGNDPDAAPSADAGTTIGDAPVMASDAAPSADLPRDRPLDTFKPVDAVTPVDSTPPSYDTADLCSGTCQMYEDEYQAALVRARICTPNVKLQCQMTAGTGLKCLGCKVWVNSNVELDAIRMKWADAGCAKCTKLCPAIACRSLTTGICHSKMLAAQDPGDRILPPPMVTGTCLDQSDPVPF